MDAPVVFFRQRSLSTKLEFKFHPDYVEFYVAGLRGNLTGFNLKYETLPNAFDYRTHRPKDQFVTFPLTIVAAATLYELAIHPRDTASSIIGFMAVFGAVLCAVGYGLRGLLKKEYTVLVTPAGRLLIAKDRKHDAIVKELASRRTAALRRAAVVDPQAPPWLEIKKFKWLRDEGIISEDDYRACRELIHASADAGAAKAPASAVLH
jgi:hypothetical protein